MFTVTLSYELQIPWPTLILLQNRSVVHWSHEVWRTKSSHKHYQALSSHNHGETLALMFLYYFTSIVLLGIAVFFFFFCSCLLERFLRHESSVLGNSIHNCLSYGVSDIYSGIPVVLAPDPLALSILAVGWLATSEGVPVEYVNNNTHHHFYIQTVQ